MGIGTGAPPRAREVQLLQQAWESVDHTVRATQAVCTYEEVGSAVLFEVNRKAVNEKPYKPFDSRLERRTTERYTNLWKKVVAYIFRIRLWEKVEGEGYIQPPFKLTRC